MNPAPHHRPRPYNGFNQLLSVSGPSGATSFGYDGNGNQVSKTDGLGTTAYAYNYDNRLVGISGPTGSSYFEYDANGLRTKKSDSTGTRSYLLDGLSVVAEYAPDASKLAWYTQSLARIDEVLNVVNAQGKYWYQSDALGSTYAMTNASGAVVSRSSYDVFGERALAAGIELAQPYGFTGREHDSSGLVYARARYLSSVQGRWLTEDPVNLRTAQLPIGTEQWLGVSPVGLASALAREGGASARYAYVSNRPGLLTDPTGEVTYPVTALLSMGALVIGAVSMATMMIGLTLFAYAVAIQERGFAEDAALIVRAAAIAMVASFTVAIALNPYFVGALLNTYWPIGVSALYLGCMGLWGVKWYSGGCKSTGMLPSLYCTMALLQTLQSGDLGPLLRFPRGV